jgi:hypothetical protein
LSEIADKLKQAPAGSVAIIASARQTNEELWLLSKLKAKLGAISDSIPRIGKGDHLLLDADKNPNTNGARLTASFYGDGHQPREDCRGHSQWHHQDADRVREDL